jgi:rare lipoprotein A
MLLLWLIYLKFGALCRSPPGTRIALSYVMGNSTYWPTCRQALDEVSARSNRVMSQNTCFGAVSRSLIATAAFLVASLAAGCGQFGSQAPPANSAALAPIPQPTIAAPESPPPPAPSHTAKASFYSDSFAGKKTASGETYDPDEMTAASKKLPIGTVVKVKNIENGRTVNVRINDHGPNVRGRDLDLSKAAARRLGLTHKGVAKVKVTRVSKHSKAVAASTEPDSTGNADAAEPTNSTAAANPGATAPASGPAPEANAAPPAAAPASDAASSSAAVQ